MDEIQDLKNRIEYLERIVSDLSNEIHDTRFVTNMFKDNVLDIVLNDRDVTTATTQVISLSGEPEDVTVPVNPSGYIVTRYRGNKIGLLYKTL